MRQEAGRVLFRVKPIMQSLTKAQEQSLVAIIIEEFGADMLLGEFTEALLSVLEDVAGFETSTELEISSLTKQLWSQYHE
jgi:hypothetical protein